MKNLYFAYGSNMDQKRLERRVGRVKPIGVGVVPNTALIFSTTEPSRRNNGYASYRHQEGRYLWGRLFELTDKQLTALDRYEGEGTAYVRTMIPVEIGGKPVTAMTYRRIDSAVIALPRKKYLDYLSNGAKQVDLAQILWESVQDALADSQRLIDAPMSDPEAHERLVWPEKFQT